MYRRNARKIKTLVYSVNYSEVTAYVLSESKVSMSLDGKYYPKRAKYKDRNDAAHYLVEIKFGHHGHWVLHHSKVELFSTRFLQGSLN